RTGLAPTALTLSRIPGLPAQRPAAPGRPQHGPAGLATSDFRQWRPPSACDLHRPASCKAPAWDRCWSHAGCPTCPPEGSLRAYRDVMSLHKLTAGGGDTYLTRQVAAADATHRGRAPLGDFYAARGESPGVWVGAGLSGLAGVDPGDHVTAAQMKALFGQGRHPNADAIR